MIRRPPRATRTDTLFPYTTLFRSDVGDHIATETDAEPFRCLHAIPEIETARVDIDALRAGAVGAGHLQPCILAITKTLQFVNQIARIQRQPGLELLRRCVDLRRQGPAGTGDTVADFTIKLDDTNRDGTTAQAHD